MAAVVHPLRVERKPQGRSLDLPTPGSDEAEVEGETKTGGQELLRVVGPYRLLKEIGRGGVAAVHKAVGRDGEQVAVKLMLEPDAAAAKRFEREAKVLSEVGRHPHIVRFTDHGTADGHLYMAMELVEGTDFADWLVTNPSLNERVRFLIQVVEAVGFAHAQGVLHRDIKPGNILRTHDGEPRVTDFGMAKEVDENTITTATGGTTTSGGIFGTVAYMSPEQTAGDRLDRRTDVYSLGVVLYEALAGRLPFRGTPVQVLTQIVRKDPEPPHEVRSDIGRGLSDVIVKCLAKERGKRYATANELAEDLQRCLDGKRPRLGRSSRAWVWALLVLGAIAAAAVAAWRLQG